MFNNQILKLYYITLLHKFSFTQSPQPGCVCTQTKQIDLTSTSLSYNMVIQIFFSKNTQDQQNNCHKIIYNDNSQHSIINVLFQWKLTDQNQMNQLSQFTPIMLVSYQNLPSNLPSLQAINQISNSTYMDLQSILIAYNKQRVRFRNDKPILQPLNIQIYNFGIAKLSFSYILTLSFGNYINYDDCQSFCQQLNGVCSYRSCICSTNRIGTECTQQVFNLNQSQPLSLRVPSFIWIFFRIYQKGFENRLIYFQDMKAEQNIKITSFYTWEEFKELYGSTDSFNEQEDIYSIALAPYNKPLYDRFGISFTNNIENQLLKVNYPNFAISYSVIDEGRQGIEQTIIDINYSQVIQGTEEEAFAYALGIFNPNGNIINIDIQMNESNPSENESLSWIIQMILYILIFLLFIMIVAICQRNYKQKKYCFKFRRQQQNSQQQQQLQSQQQQQLLNGNEQVPSFNQQQYNEIQLQQQSSQQQDQQQQLRRNLNFPRQRLNEGQNARPLAYRQMIAKVLLDTFMPLEKGIEIRENYQWENNLDECAICIEPISDEDICRISYCFHVFHQDCLDQWLKTNNTCPYCRSSMSVDDFVQHYYEHLEAKKNRKIKKLKQAIATNIQNTSIKSLFQSEISVIQSIISDLTMEQCFYSSSNQFDSLETQNENKLKNLNEQLANKLAKENKQKQVIEQIDIQEVEKQNLELNIQIETVQQAQESKESEKSQTLQSLYDLLAQKDILFEQQELQEKKTFHFSDEQSDFQKSLLQESIRGIFQEDSSELFTKSFEQTNQQNDQQIAIKDEKQKKLKIKKKEKEKEKEKISQKQAKNQIKENKVQLAKNVSLPNNVISSTKNGQGTKIKKDEKQKAQILEKDLNYMKEKTKVNHLNELTIKISSKFDTQYRGEIRSVFKSGKEKKKKY